MINNFSRDWTDILISKKKDMQYVLERVENFRLYLEN